MNYRDYKQFRNGTIHHVYNRGVGKMDIFLDDQDRRVYIRLLRENFFPPAQILIPTSLHGHHPDGDHGGSGAALISERHTPYLRRTLPPESFSLLCYCLMPNHFHLVIKQLSDLPVGDLVSRVSNSYSKYFNKKYERVGSLYQDTFKAVLVESDSQLIWLSAYVHSNPKTGGLVEDLRDYQWSSYPDYAGLRQGTLCDKKTILDTFPSVEAYKKFVDDAGEKIKERKDLQYLLLD